MMMKKGCLLLLGLMLLLLPNVCAAAKSLTDYPTLAMVPFTNKAPADWENFSDYAAPAADEVGFVLQNSGRFETFSCEDLQNVIDMKSLEMTGLVESNKERQAAKILGADYLVIGSVTELSSDTTVDEVGTGWDREDLKNGASYEHRTVYAKVSLRVVDAGTGRIVLYGQGEGSSANGLFTANIQDIAVKVGSVRYSGHQCAKAINDAAHNAITGKRGILSILDGKANLGIHR